MLSLAQGALACDFPKSVNQFPNGNTATEQEMFAAQKTVKAYVGNMDAYLDCIESAEAEALIAMGEIDEDLKRQRSDHYEKKRNAAIDELNRVVEQYNIQVRAFKESNK